VLNNRGNTLFELKRFEEALASYDRAIVLRPNLVEAINNRGNALRALKRLGEAFSCHRLGPNWTERRLRVSESLCLVMTNRRHPRPTWKDIDKGCARRSATLCRMNSST
jgi:tetratricopeptide (TPR) repeat protein